MVVYRKEGSNIKKDTIVIALYIIVLLGLFFVGHKLQLLYPNEKTSLLLIVCLLKKLEKKKKKELHIVLWIPIILISGIVFSLGMGADLHNLIYSGALITIGGVLFFPELEEKD